MEINVDGLAKLVALVLWADEKVTDEELSVAESVFSKYGISWADAKKDLDSHLEDIYDPGEGDEEFTETDEDFDIGRVYLGEVDDLEVLNDLSALIVADKIVSLSEIDILHRIANAIGAQPELATAALLKATKESNAEINIE